MSSIEMVKGQNIVSLLLVFMGTIASYLIVKFLLRPFVTSNDYSGFIKIVVFSYPNFCEAIAGTIGTVLMLLTAKGIISNMKPGLIIKEKLLYKIAVLFSGIYVLLQEFKFHNLGGNNVYDFYDVLFSILGLVTVYVILINIQPRIISIQ